jgi:antitoxin component of MazEF toxin-antitoxin module
MAIVIVGTDEKHMALPADIMAALNLHVGDEVTAVVEGDAIRVSRLDKFLALRGSLANDNAFDQSIEALDQEWQAWTSAASA